MEYVTRYSSPLGEIFITGSEEGLTGIYFEGQKYFPKGIIGNIKENDDLDIFIKAKEVLDNYFSTGKINLNGLRLSPVGSEFRQKVWKILREIPDGQTTTYKDVASRISLDEGKNMSAQAVGGAVGHNPISILIPCHRVVGSDKNLTGYAGGVDRKIKLLELEGFNSEEFTLPK